MEEKNRLIPADEKELQDPENLIKNTEADTEGIVDFMHEEIKKRPMNRRKLLRRARETSLIAILFGTVSCIVFAILLPVINNILYPSENTAQTVMLPEENPYEELTPEDMVENERKLEAKEEKEWIREELQGILDEKIIGVEQQKRISSALQELASESSGMIAAVSGISSDMDWFNDSYEDKNTVSGLVTKKSAEGIFILVQSRRISDAQRIMVTFHEGTEAEAQAAVSAYNKASQAIYNRVTPKKKREIETKQYMLKPVEAFMADGELKLDFDISVTPEGSVKPLEVFTVIVESFGLKAEPNQARIERTGLLGKGRRLIDLVS